MDFLSYVRIFLMIHYNGPDYQKIRSTIPVSYVFEIFALKFSLNLILFLQKSYSTTLEEDYKILLLPDLKMNERFIIIYRISQK